MLFIAKAKPNLKGSAVTAVPRSRSDVGLYVLLPEVGGVRLRWGDDRWQRSHSHPNSIADISPHSRATEHAPAYPGTHCCNGARGTVHAGLCALCAERCAVTRGAKRAERCEERGAVTVRASGAVRAERCAVHGARCAVHGAMST
jgi:hypothetical protein